MYLKGDVEGRLFSFLFFCDLSHENFIEFMKQLDSIGVIINASSREEWSETIVKDSATYDCLWSDEDNWIEVLNIVKERLK
jgi:hypothetical protein